MLKVAKIFLLTIVLITLGKLLPAAWFFLTYEQKQEIAYVRNDSRPSSLAKIVCGEDEEVGINLVRMAIFAADVYSDGAPELLSYLSPNWKKLVFTSEDRKSLFPNESISGLYFDLWSNKQERISVIAFRGTDGPLDFYSNFHWLTKYLPFETQYQKVRNATPKLVSWLQQKNAQDHMIYTTGHSLGGGLAQYALYSHKLIKEAYAFNSSPVTGWSDIDEKTREINVVGNKVVRVHENKEVLEFFRLLMKMTYVFNPRPNENPYFVEYRFNFSSNESQNACSRKSASYSRVKQHEMIGLAQGLVERVKCYCPS